MNYSQIINDKMNSDIKNRYANILEQEYNIIREPKGEIIPFTSNVKKANRQIINYVAAAMLLLLFGTALFFTNNQTIEDPKEMIHQYMAANDLSDIATTRSASNTAVSITPEQRFSEAMNLLLDANYDAAVKAFQVCNNEIKSGEAFYPETQVYLIISLVLNDQNNLAKTLYNQLPEDSWEQQQLQQIILNVE